MSAPTIHASAVLVGARAILIQGPSGSGKSRLAMALLDAAGAGLVPFARLVADDRCHLETAHGRLLVRPAPALAGLIEVRGLGIRRVPARAGRRGRDHRWILGVPDDRAGCRPTRAGRRSSAVSGCRG